MTHERFPLYLSGNREGLLIAPRPLTLEDIALLQRQMEHALSVMRQVFVIDEPHPAPPTERCTIGPDCYVDNATPDSLPAEQEAQR